MTSSVTTLARIRDDVERVHRRATNRHLHLDAAPRELVRALTADLHRGRGGDRQLDLAAEALEPFAASSASPGGAWHATTSPSGSPVEVRAGEIDLGDVALVQADEARCELSCPSGQQKQEARGERIERSRVTSPRARHCCGSARRPRTTMGRAACRRARRPRAQARAVARWARKPSRICSTICCSGRSRGEAGGLAVSAASEATRNRRDVELVDARAERTLVCLRASGSAAPGPAPQARPLRRRAGSR